MICPKCSKVVPDNTRFCGSCGQQLDTPAAAAAPEPLVTVAADGTAAWTANATQFPGLIDRIKRILLSPREEWAIIAAEPTSAGQLYTGYVVPLAALAAVMSFVRMSLIGVSLPFGTAQMRTPMVAGLTYALVTFGFGLLGLFLVGLIINGLAPTFSGQRDQRQALKTAERDAFTPAWLSTVLGLLPGLATLLQLLAGIYGIYLLYLGLPPLMPLPPKDKSFGKNDSVINCTFLLGLVLGAVGAATGAFSRMGGGLAGLSSAQSQAQAQEQGAAIVGNVLGGVLGTDAKGKAGLAAALDNLAKTGQQMEAQQAAASAAPAATPAASAATPADAQSAATAATGLLTALGGALGGSHPADPVGFQNLKAMLPAALPGMQRTGAEGSDKQALGVKGSSASANYRDANGSQVQISIADAAGVAGLMDLAGALNQTTNSESDSGYEKDTTLGGRQVHEKYDGKSRHGELNAIIAKRFEVDVTGDAVDMSTLEQDLGTVDLARLESMKDAGAQAR